MKQTERCQAAFWGLCFGEALGRTHLYKNPPYLLHGATGTWFLTLLEAAQTSDSLIGSSLKDDLARRLQFLNAPFHGLALRAKARSLGTSLRHVAQHYSKYRNLHAAASHDLNGDVLPSAMSLAFLDCSDEVLATKLIDAITVTHRHPRVVSAAALLVASVREWIKDPNATLPSVLEVAQSFAAHTLTLFGKHAEQETMQSMVLAKQALVHHVALGKGVVDVSDLGFPYGFDGRDSPEQMVVLALAISSTAKGDVATILFELLERGGASDILAPLVGAMCGLRLGASIFLRQWHDALLSNSFWQSYLPGQNVAIKGSRSIAEQELELSLSEEATLNDLGALSFTNASKEQLAFL